MYVFGYRSLIWNPGFEFQTSELAEIKNTSEVFPCGQFIIEELSKGLVWFWLWKNVMVTAVRG